MAIVSASPLNTFCWAELCSNDWQAAKTFYLNLFDWTAVDQPIGEDFYYTLMQKQGVDVAAMYQMMPMQAEQGVPSHWLGYVAVDNVDAMAEKAIGLGAKVLCEPHDVPAAGRTVMLEEPGGAVFSLWQANGHPGTQRKLETNVPYWHELATKDAQQSRSFYCGLFGWQAELKPMEGFDYTLFCVDGSPIAGMMQMTAEWGNIPPHWMIYFAVANTDAMLTKVEQLGGQVCVPATDIPEVGRFAVITDPSGAVCSILQSCMNDVCDD
ncbi:VOC family protein [Pseudoalteromonas fenneropenaei]|uniref:VOC family protein n=1 Tax=Pseudoalteromonas fenneropenaei TaxID=1737459 RepID=A0ABV7CLQ7_9GAMM